MTSRRPRRVLAGAVTLVGVLATGCDAPAGRVTRPGPPPAGCALVTASVIRAAHFPDRVYKHTHGTGAGKHGASGCTVGDDPNPADLSPSALELLVLPPPALRFMHTTAASEVRQTGSPCPSGDRESFTAGEVTGSYCATRGRSPAGGWIRAGTAYLLEVGYPDVDYGSKAAHVREFTAVASAILANVS